MEKGGKSKRTRAVVDRIEDGGTAVVYLGDEEDVRAELPASLLPEGAGSGSHIVINISLDEDSRSSAEERMKAMQERLERRGGGDRKDFKM